MLFSIVCSRWWWLLVCSVVMVGLVGVSGKVLLVLGVVGVMLSRW